MATMVNGKKQYRPLDEVVDELEAINFKGLTEDETHGQQGFLDSLVEDLRYRLVELNDKIEKLEEERDKMETERDDAVTDLGGDIAHRDKVIELLVEPGTRQAVTSLPTEDWELERYDLNRGLLG